MPNTYVAIDLETTGLKAERDAIIEVAAVKFDQTGILDEFSSLVYPLGEIPPEITRLTGINNEMVADAPTIGSLRPALRRFLADHILVGHNIEFDLAFLKEAYIGVGSHRMDTVTLASILLPAAGRYSLEALARRLSLAPFAGAQDHRALSDARLTVALFASLQDTAVALGMPRLEEIVQAGRALGWPETAFFEEALQELARRAFEEGLSRRRLQKLFDPPAVSGASLTGEEEEPTPIDAGLIAGMLQPGGNFSQAFPGYEYREQQVNMVYAVAEALNHSDHLFIEAGTGTGKSVAYLLPAAFWASQNERHVVVSTNTINLQDQLIHKDIPQLQKLLPFELRAAILKGKRNYLCTRLFEQMRHRGPGNKDEMALFGRILAWLPGSSTGDVAEISLRTTEEQLAWSRLSAENDGCNRETCAQARCPLHFSRQRARVAHIIIVNHSLLLADVLAGNAIIPPYKELIIDEAHHLEAAVTDSLSFRADKRYLQTMLEEIIRPRAGLLGQIQANVKSAVPEEANNLFAAQVDQVRQYATLARTNLEDFFDTVAYFMREQMGGYSQYARQLRLTPAVRTQPFFDELEIGWDNLGKPLKLASNGLLRLAEMLSDSGTGFDISDVETLQLELTNLARDLEEVRQNVQAIISAPAEGWIYWIESWQDRLSLHAALLHVGPLVEKHIFASKETVILTSATMRTARTGYTEPGFEYIRARLHGFEALEMAVGSPFDYKRSTLVYLPTDIPEPNQPGYQRYVEQAIADVARTLGGRTMALFTSYGQLTQTARALRERLHDAGIAVLAQGEGMSRQQLLEQFKTPETHAVLLGTRSFWEGVDVPGPALQALLLVRIPFDVPSDPIFAARSETYDNAFFEYSIPEAVLRFRQGFGRLIRRKDDEGIVVILDKRVLSKRYGQLFLEALPECTILRQRVGRLAELTERWFNRVRPDEA